MPSDPSNGKPASPPQIALAHGAHGNPPRAPGDERLPDRQPREGDQQDADRITAHATERVADLTRALVFVNAAYVIISAWVLVTSQGQLTTMQNDQRPWLSITPKLENVPRFDWKGQISIQVNIGFEFRNYGRLPAQNITFKLGVSPWPGNLNIKRLDPVQRDLCVAAENEAMEHKTAGITVFPDQKPINLPPAAEVGIGIPVPLYKTQPEILFSSYGCVDYTFADGSHGKALFRYFLGSKATGNIRTGIPIKPGKPMEPGQPEPTISIFTPADLDFSIDPSGGNYIQ